jgi:hypothetical protein
MVKLNTDIDISYISEELKLQWPVIINNNIPLLFFLYHYNDDGTGVTGRSTGNGFGEPVGYKITDYKYRL